MLEKRMLFLGVLGALVLAAGAANAKFECNGQIGYEAGKRCGKELGFTQTLGSTQLDRDRTDPSSHDARGGDDRGSDNDRGDRGECGNY